MACGEPWNFQQQGKRYEDVIGGLEERIRILEARMLILEPHLELFDKYPALREAYKEYKVIERLILGNEIT
jgi:hypothetical protein